MYIVFCSVLFCSFLFCSGLFHSILFRSGLFHSIQFRSAPFRSALVHCLLIALHAFTCIIAVLTNRNTCVDLPHLTHASHNNALIKPFFQPGQMSPELVHWYLWFSLDSLVWRLIFKYLPFMSPQSLLSQPWICQQGTPIYAVHPVMLLEPSNGDSERPALCTEALCAQDAINGCPQLRKMAPELTRMKNTGWQMRAHDLALLAVLEISCRINFAAPVRDSQGFDADKWLKGHEWLQDGWMWFCYWGLGQYYRLAPMFAGSHAYLFRKVIFGVFPCDDG